MDHRRWCDGLQRVGSFHKYGMVAWRANHFGPSRPQLLLHQSASPLLDSFCVVVVALVRKLYRVVSVLPFDSFFVPFSFRALLGVWRILMKPVCEFLFVYRLGAQWASISSFSVSVGRAHKDCDSAHDDRRDTFRPVFAATGVVAQPLLPCVLGTSEAMSHFHCEAVA